jgi:glyoxylase-like metal-dependent hydrolase (beta-lactamase superfamily II)
MVVHDRLQDVHLTFLGRAHTGSDICVWSPSEKVVATGDLLVGFVPGMGDGYPLEWPGTLLRLSDLGFDLVAPGHGDVQTGRVRLSQMRGYLLELVERVSALVGESLEDVLRVVDFGSLRSLRGEFGEYLASNTARYRMMAPGTDVRAVLASAVRGNVEAVYFHAKTQRR